MKDLVLRAKVGLGGYCDTYMPTRLVVSSGTSWSYRVSDVDLIFQHG